MTTVNGPVDITAPRTAMARSNPAIVPKKTCQLNNINSVVLSMHSRWVRCHRFAQTRSRRPPAGRSMENWRSQARNSASSVVIGGGTASAGPLPAVLVSNAPPHPGRKMSQVVSGYRSASPEVIPGLNIRLNSWSDKA